VGVVDYKGRAPSWWDFCSSDAFFKPWPKGSMPVELEMDFVCLNYLCLGDLLIPRNLEDAARLLALIREVIF
jgi:hypothetical protein